MEGAELEVVISDFESRVFLLITECCKMGTLVRSQYQAIHSTKKEVPGAG